MDSAVKAFRSKSRRYERSTRQRALRLDVSEFNTDLSLPCIEPCDRRRYTEDIRSVTPSTKATSPISNDIRPVSLLVQPQLTSQSWSVYSYSSACLLSSSHLNDRREIASLTKILTCYLSLRIFHRLNVSLQTLITVSKTATQLPGTSAGLQEHDQLTIWDLLHGLMLPSGNDAAYCLADFTGKLIHDNFDFLSPSRNFIGYFVKEMNAFVKKQKLKNTLFTNPHGLIDPFNRSSAGDIGKIAILCMKNRHFRSIVRTKSFKCVINPENTQKRREIEWINSNKMLNNEWIGVKTGVTRTAGPCLVSCWQGNRGEMRVITVLGCESMEKRWREVEILAKWSEEMY